MSMTVAADPVDRIDAPSRRKKSRRSKTATGQRSDPALRGKRPISAARLAANQRNALKSTGPRTVEGKKRSARNALKHGLRAKSVFDGKPAAMSFSPVLPGECSATFQTIKEELREEFHPRTAMENWLIDGIATQLWRLMRCNDFERRMIEAEGRRIAIERHEAMNDANEADAVSERLTVASVLAELFGGERSGGMMLVARYQGQMQRLMLGMIMRLEALRKRKNEDLYSREDRDAAKYPGHSETFKRTGWPDMSPRAAPAATAAPAPEPAREPAVPAAARPTPGSPTVGSPAVNAPPQPPPKPSPPELGEVEDGGEPSHSKPAFGDENPLQRAANAVSLPIANEISDRTKPPSAPRIRDPALEEQPRAA